MKPCHHPFRILFISAVALLLTITTTGCEQLQGGGDSEGAVQGSAEAAGDDPNEGVDGPGDAQGASAEFADSRQADGSPAPTRPTEPRFRNPGDSRDGSSSDDDDDYAEWTQRQRERRERANERRRRNRGSVSIGEEPQRQRIPASVAGELTNRQLDRFARAAESVADIYMDGDFEKRMMEASSYEEAMEIQADIEDEIRQRIERSGLSYEEYLGISQRLGNEPELERRLAERVGTPSQAQYMQGGGN